MKSAKKLLCLCLALALSLSLAGCTIPVPGFADYDVSGYVKALLDSSYHGENEGFIRVAGTTQEKAQQNNADTVENAAVLFCNTYGIYPSDEQLAELQRVMRQVYALTEYTVKEERKTDAGYYLEVEVSPITNYRGRSADLERLLASAQEEANRVNTNASEDGTGYENDGYEDYEDNSSSQIGSTSNTVDANELYVDKVVEFCKEELKSIVYDTSVTIPLEILQTDEGELQMDVNQISTLDKTVVYLTK